MTQKTRADFKTDKNTAFADNTAGDIGADDLRAQMDHLADSALFPEDSVPSHNHAASDLTSGTLPDALVAESNVTQHEAALTVTESQISDLGSYITDYTVTESDVTAHEAALTITESQISDLGNYIESVEGTAVLSTGEGGGSKFLREDGDGTCSWQAIPGGGDALTSSPLSQFAATTSAQLAGVMSDETGTGALVFADSPTLVTPALGTPSAAVLTNATGLPISGIASWPAGVTLTEVGYLDGVTSAIQTQIDTKAATTLSVNAQTGTSYTLVLSDAGRKVTMSNASANTLTIPTNASVAFPTGTIIGVSMIGAGTTTVDGDTGVTVNGVSGGGAAINGRYTGVTLTKIGPDAWLMEGNHGTVA